MADDYQSDDDQTDASYSDEDNQQYQQSMYPNYLNQSMNGYGNYGQIMGYNYDQGMNDYNQAQIDQSYMNGYNSYPMGQFYN